MGIVDMQLTLTHTPPLPPLQLQTSCYTTAHNTQVSLQVALSVPVQPIIVWLKQSLKCISINPTKGDQ